MLRGQRHLPLNKSGQRSLSLLTPLEIYEALNKDIIGQHHVKISIAVGLHNHLLRCQIPKKKKIETIPKKEKDKIFTNLGQNFISNTDWMVKRDLVNLKVEMNQLKKEISDMKNLYTQTATRTTEDESKVKTSLSFTMAGRMKIDEESPSTTLPPPMPLNLDVIRQSNLQNRETYHQSTKSQSYHPESLNTSSSSASSTPVQANETVDDETDSPLDGVVLTNGQSIPSVRLDKTNILLLGPTGVCVCVCVLYLILQLNPSALSLERLWKDSDREVSVSIDRCATRDL
jgi:hypothetical protein